MPIINHLDGGLVVRAWDQEIYSFCGLRFEPCGCSYDGHWRLTWSLTLGPVRLVEVRANWPDTHVKLKKKTMPIIASIISRAPTVFPTGIYALMHIPQLFL